METPALCQPVAEQTVVVSSKQVKDKNICNKDYSPCRWSTERAHEWLLRHEWIVGCNYLPATAINQLEMWQPESFDPFTIDKELSWASHLGFNSIRVFLHYLVWKQDPQGYLRRLDHFFSIASKHGIKTVPVLFDSVWDPFPRVGKQPEPRLYVHNSGWVQCPGYEVLNNPGEYDDLRDYVEGIVGAFKDDHRVLMWDLYNEPDNMNLSSYKDDKYVQHKADLAMNLLQKTVAWVRHIDPVQPLTMAPWQWEDMSGLSALDQYMFTESDVITFHCYENKEGMEKRIVSLKAFDRPIICTEYMARALGCTLQDILPLLKRHGIGAFNWGFVKGKSQTHAAWDSWEMTDQKEPDLWFHDILHSNGEPYSYLEVEFLKEITHREVLEVQKVA